MRASVQNAKDLIEFGRLGDPWGSPYEIVHSSRRYRLRRYASAHTSEPGASEREQATTRVRAPVLLIPPLMVTSEVYDVAPDVSAVAFLVGAGLDVWLVDFGAPEREEGGLERTLDDHVLAIDDAITRARAEADSDVHLVGYSQGGMFCYQTAAYRRCEGVASIITFGSPVDIHRNLPAIDAEVGSRVIGAARRAVAKPLEQLEGLPGILTSSAFKVVSLRKELQQISDFMTKLHDRDALIKRESRRRFLGGEGFVAWPGPALRTFVDEFIVANRMSAGGFVIAGRTATLAELDVPILYFVGERDDIARPASVRGIAKAAPAAESYELSLPAGHFGLVVGSTANTRSWPAVAEWVRWREGAGPRPEALPDPEAARVAAERLRQEYDDIEAFDVEADFEPIVDVVGSLARSFLARVEDRSRELGDSFDDMRYQLPRLRTLERLAPDTRISLAFELADRAARSPDRTFFLWKGRAFSYAEADRRVDAIVRGFIDRGVRAGQRVGVIMDGRPSYLSVVTALNRLGAVAVLYKPHLGGPIAGAGAGAGAGERAERDDEDRQASARLLGEALAQGELAAVVADPPNAAEAVEAWTVARRDEPVLVLGGGPERDPSRPLPAGVFDMEAIDPTRVELPAWYVPNPGRARDLALVVVTVRPWAGTREARISNARWAVSAYGSAASCLLSSKDTVYSVLPLHHPAGMLVAVGGALVGRSRLALSAGFDPENFWAEVRRYGATVAFYAGEQWRLLADAPRSPSEGNHPLRLIAGSGMRADLWRRVEARFGPIGIREFYASTEGNLVLANVADKPGALGRPMPGTNELAVVAYDFAANDFVRDSQGHARRCRVNEAGLLIAKVDPTHPGLREPRPAGHRGETFLSSVFGKRDTWFVTGDLVRRDAEGDFWYVDRTSHLIHGPHGWIASREIEDVIYAGTGQTGIEGDDLGSVRLVVVHGVARDELPEALASAGVPGAHAFPIATLVVAEPARFDPRSLERVVAGLRPEQRPIWVRVRARVALSDGYRPLKSPLRAEPIDPGEAHALRWDPGQSRYLPLEGSQVQGSGPG